MDDASLKIFIDIVLGFFGELSGESVEMGVPYIKREKGAALEYTGIIGISGSRKGGLYLSASAPLLRDLSELITGEACGDEGLADVVGEAANMIAGNARRDFGSEFLISVPIVVRGALDDITMRLAPPVFVIPVRWRTHSFYLSIGIE